MKETGKYNYKKILLIVAAALVALIVFLFCSTDIVLRFQGLNITETGPIDATGQDTVYSSIFYTTVRGGISDEVNITGYAYMETDLPNPDKRIDLYLVSDEHVYQMSTTLGEHYGLTREQTGHNVQGSRHMFSRDFSYAQMKDGTYTLFIACYENEQAYGCTGTPFAFRKEGRNFVPLSDYEGILQPDIDIHAATVDAPVYHSIEVCQKEKNAIQIRGWAAAIGYPSNHAKIMMALTNSQGQTLVYDTAQFIRYYLRSTLSSDMYDHSTFYTNIPLDGLTPDTYTLSILVQADTLRIAPVKHRIKYASDGSITFIQGSLESPYPITEVKYSEKQSLDISKFTDNPILYHSIGVCNLQDELYLLIQGWALEVGTPSDDATVLIGLTNETGDTIIYDTEPYSNPYLREVMDSDIYDDAFFECRIPSAELSPGAYTMSVLVRGQQYGRSAVTHTFILGQDGTVEYTP